ncbi:MULTISPECIES: 2-hydroxyacid dehydrogenase [unclassified Halomonas]|uniref:2-hydroxyacid dehydrogenase n=1 Tax=unclassified Halomonas TaxID=2609666 RepID=UPI0006DA73C2|nr:MULTISPECIES: D-glycerate dehydrogenase [unclassified Halomonas]KPQ27954.1 MAG: gluconate 2-dehydrogenase [Halomonas sp. HL-93]SBR51721.1 phosphogluconate 2-dehydrogenase [Halomonas sp. HL-93]SNY97484.1 phosphogluconate 2-dehydrogenase [Halomonas sp. hl-4]
MAEQTKPWRIVAVRRLSEAQRAALSEIAEVDYFEDVNASNHADFMIALSKAHGLIGGKLELSDAMLAQAPVLQVVATISVGYDHLPLEALNRRGILLCNTPDVLTETTADTAFALIMATQRRLVELSNLVREGGWQAHIGPEHFGVDVHGKTLGIVGAGRIGAAIARRGALGFGMPILYTAASPKSALEQELGAKRCDLNELLSQADIVCLSVPYNADTHHLIDAGALARMKPTAALVNVARGKVVDEPALIEALRSGLIRAAGLDVFAEEPLPTDSPLASMANVVAAPHIGSATHETRDAMAQLAVDNLLGALAGSGPLTAVNERFWRRSAATEET